MQTLVGAVPLGSVVLHARWQHVVEADPHACLQDAGIKFSQGCTVIESKARAVLQALEKHTHIHTHQQQVIKGGKGFSHLASPD